MKRTQAGYRRSRSRTRAWWISCSILLSLGAGGVLAQDVATDGSGLSLCYLEQKELLVEIDSTGIADGRFTNPRWPFPVVTKDRRVCRERSAWRAPTQRDIELKGSYDPTWDLVAAEAASVIFRNTAPGLAAVLKIGYVYEPPKLKDRVDWLGQRLEQAGVRERQFVTALSPLVCRDSNDGVFAGGEQQGKSCTAQRHSKAALDGVGKLVDELRLVLSQTAKVEAAKSAIRDSPSKVSGEISSRRDFRQDPSYVAAIRNFKEVLDISDECLPEAQVKRSPLTPSELRTLGFQLCLANHLGSASGGKFDPASLDRRAQEGLGVLFRNLGEAAVALGEVRESEDTTEVVKSATKGLAEELSALRDALGLLAQVLPSLADSGPPQGECPSLLPQRQACAWSTTLFEGGVVELKGDLWQRLVRHSRGVLEVKVEFFDERNIVSNNTAYLRVKSRIVEPENATSWKLSGTVGSSVRPEVDRNLSDGLGGFFTTEEPYDDGRNRGFNASAKLVLSQQLGSLARARVVGQFKNGDFGESDSSGDFKVPEYEISVFGRQGISLHYGKMNFASPASNIALREVGEGFELRYRGLSLAHLVKRESLSGVADDANDDTDVTLGTFRFKPFRTGPLRFVQATFLDGESHEKDRTAYDHQTFGAEAFLGWLLGEKQEPPWSATARLAYFDSDREVKRVEAASTPGGDGEEELPASFVTVPEGSGATWLMDLSLTRLAALKPGKAPKAARTFSLVMAAGDGDDPNTPEDEGFIGETNAFSPDLLFLSSLAGSLRDPLVEIPSSEEGGESTFRLGTSVIRSGLSNKRYLGGRYVERKRAGSFSPLHGLAYLLGVGDEIFSEAFTLSVHLYRLDYPIFGSSDAGREIDLKWEIEVPKGVKASLEAGIYSPGDATEPFFLEDAFIIKTGLSITL